MSIISTDATAENLFIGLAIGGTKTSISLGDSRGRLYHNSVIKTKPHYNDVLEDIYKEIDNLIDTENSGLHREIAAIGVSCGGPLDSEKGLILSPPNLVSWDEVPVIALLGERYNIPCFLENDANSGLIAEFMWGNGQGCKNCVFLTFGTGMGAGLILNGRLYTGSTGLAGEVGHIRIADDGPECYGKRGSWESYCSGTGIERLYLKLFEEKMSTKEICDRAEAGDSRAMQVISTSSKYLGMGVSVILDLLNPERVIIGSIFSRREKLFRKNMEKYLGEEALSHTYESCRILPSGLGELGGEKSALATAVVHSDKKLKEALYG